MKCKLTLRFLAAALALLLLPALAPGYGGHTARADALEDRLLGTVSAQYESNGDPGSISGGEGDLGGASYGAYQFPANFDGPLTFARWCVSSGRGKTEGNRLIAAYEQDGNRFGSHFNAAWKALAAEDKSGFLTLQRLYTKTQYYDKAVTALQTYFSLDISLYGIAFKNAVWSRTVQHGLGSFTNRNGFLGLLRRVDEALPGGLTGTPEKELILAIYEESGKVVTTGTNKITAAAAGGNAWIVRKYGLEGKYLKYYSGNSAAVQAGVYLRLRVNEPADLLDMLEEYGGFSAPTDHGQITPTLQLDRLVLTTCDTLRGFSAGTNTTVQISAQKHVGGSSVGLTPKATVATGRTPVNATLRLTAAVDFTAFDELTFSVYIPVAQKGSESRLQIYGRSGQATAFTLRVALKGLAAGWHRLSLALPEVDGTLPVDRLAFSCAALDAGYPGKTFLLDQICAVSHNPGKAYQTGRVKADALNCRAEPTTDATSFGTFPQNATVTVLGEGLGGWYYCVGKEADGTAMAGWCSGDYLTLSAYEVHTGDLTGDGKVNAADALLALRAAVGKATLSAAERKTGDLDRDGKVNATDALYMLRVAVGKL